QVHSLAIGSIEIVRGRPHGKKDQTALRVYTHERPHIRPGAILPRLFLPTLMPRFSWVRNGVKNPNQLARANVKGAHRATWALRGILGNGGPAMLEVLASTGLPGLRIKLPNLFATFRIERNHAVRRSREVQHAINHERSGFKWGDVVPVGFIGAAIHFSHVISPRSFQSGD